MDAIIHSYMTWYLILKAFLVVVAVRAMDQFEVVAVQVRTR